MKPLTESHTSKSYKFSASHFSSGKSSSGRWLLAAVSSAVFVFSAGGWANGKALPALEKQWDMLENYCVDCHNFEDWAGGVSLDSMSAGEVGSEAEVWEAVIGKLTAGMMPPAGQKQPSIVKRNDFIKALEGSLDEHAESNPNPGTVVLHRLNRTEYANAVEEILGVKVVATDLLPQDDISDGFDNVASVLKVSPSFIEQYISAARAVSVQALGKANASTVGKVYPGAPNARQYVHVDGLPLGTRGGMLVEHDFPADGEYDFTINGLVGAGYVWGALDPDKLIITIDDEKVFEQAFGGGDDLKAVDIEQSKGVGEINGRFKNIRRFVSAGPHRVGVTFIAKSSAEHHDWLHQFSSVEGMSILVQGTGGGPRIDNLVVNGPFDPQGVSSTPSRKKIFTCYPEVASQQVACAEQIFSNLARKAFRRPVGQEDIAGAMQFFERGLEQGSFEQGIQKGLMAILASPKFLYRAHTPPAGTKPGEMYAIEDTELASRLSFFLWSRPPDTELLEVAAAGQLSSPKVLRQQVKRMLADFRARSLVNNFAFKWFNVEGLELVNPDPDIFPQYTPDLIHDFEKELELFIASIFEQDNSVVDLLTADHTYLNERLAVHYGMNNVRGGQFQRVTLEDEHRWGMFGKGALLMATSYADRTSPVLRGNYILDKFIGVHPPAPPPNVDPNFPETEAGLRPPTVRQQLETHREQPSCHACHAVIDPLGIALENFNVVGQWRDKDRDAGLVIDASGNLVDGSPLDGVIDMRDALSKDRSLFAKTFTKKMMTYALGRQVEYFDMPVVRKIVREAESDDYSLSSIVLGIVTSDSFTMGQYIAAQEQEVAHNN